ncbi:hypothetical protein ACLMJK_004578 [Lecanora helva]
MMSSTGQVVTVAPSDEQINLLVAYYIDRKIWVRGYRPNLVPEGRGPQKGHIFITIPISIIFRDFKMEILKALRAIGEPNNPTPIPKGTDIDVIKVTWGGGHLASHPTHHITNKDNLSVVLQQLRERRGYDYIWVELKGEEISSESNDTKQTKWDQWVAVWKWDEWLAVWKRKRENRQIT